MHSLQTAHSASTLTEHNTGYQSVCVVSPGKEDDEQKDQDRIALKTIKDESGAQVQLAAVCDGTTTSPYAAAAAAYVAGEVESLLHHDRLKQVVDGLLKLRADLASTDIDLGEYQSELLKNIFTDIVRQKRQHAYQTTFVAVSVTHHPHYVSIKAAGCGDSALFIFKASGELLYSNIGVRAESDPFAHDSPFTSVLPDNFDEAGTNALLEDARFTSDVHLLLCSDGFYDAFANFSELFNWLVAQQADLIHTTVDNSPLLEGIHNRLKQTKGDDDVSFVWLFPNHNQPSANGGQFVQPETPAQKTTASKNCAEDDVVCRFPHCLLALFRRGLSNGV